MKVAGYGRMSTDDQQLSPKVQEQMIRDWFAREKKAGSLPSDAVFAGMFVDGGVTSRINMLDRKAGQHLLVALDAGDLIVCAKFNRAFRSAGDAEATLSRLDEAGIRIRFLDMSIDTTNANGKMMAGILAVVSKHERDLRSETTRDALWLKRRKGQAITAAPPGWRNVKRDGVGILVPHKGERLVALAAKKLLQDGMSRREVLRRIAPHKGKYGIKDSLNPVTLVDYASAACLGFPRQSKAYIGRLLGFSINRIDFIRNGDHQMVRNLLKQRLLEEGICDEQEAAAQVPQAAHCRSGSSSSGRGCGRNGGTD